MDIPVQRQKSKIFNKRNLLWLIAVILFVILASIPLRQGAAIPTVDKEDVWLGQVKHGELKQQVLGVGELAPKNMRWIV